MDLRAEKTNRSIINAFLQLRSQKPLEKITVRELAALAEINKATFYLHYHDIYDLSESLEKDAVQSTLRSIQHPEELFVEVDSVQHLPALVVDDAALLVLVEFECRLLQLDDFLLDRCELCCVVWLHCELRSFPHRFDDLRCVVRHLLDRGREGCFQCVLIYMVTIAYRSAFLDPCRAAPLIPKIYHPFVI